MLSNHCDPNPEIQNTQFASLQLISRNIKILDKIRPSFCFISQLYLDHNQLITLNGIQQFQNLQVLSFNFNHIGAFSQLNKITNKFFIKQLSFIGNPLQSDLRANFKFLATHQFTNLSILNPISNDKLKSRLSKNFVKLKEKNKEKNIENSSQYENDGKTQRHKGQMHRNQILHTRRNQTRTQNNQKQQQKIRIKETYRLSSQKIRQYQYQQDKKTNISTTANKYYQNQYITNSGSVGNGRLKKQKNKKQIKIQPFNTIQQPQYPEYPQYPECPEQPQYPEQKININKIINKNRTYQQQQQYMQQNSQKQLQKQSRIKYNGQQESIQVFNRTGYFQNQSLIDQFIMYKKNRNNQSLQPIYRQYKQQQQQQQQVYNQYRIKSFKNNKFKNLAIQFLQQQKIAIAQAFRIRYLKQQIFSILFNLKSNRYQQQLQLKRKAWATIKIYNTINQIYKHPQHY